MQGGGLDTQKTKEDLERGDSCPGQRRGMLGPSLWKRGKRETPGTGEGEGGRIKGQEEGEENIWEEEKGERKKEECEGERGEAHKEKNMEGKEARGERREKKRKK